MACKWILIINSVSAIVFAYLNCVRCIRNFHFLQTLVFLWGFHFTLCVCMSALPVCVQHLRLENERKSFCCWIIPLLKPEELLKHGINMHCGVQWYFLLTCHWLAFPLFSLACQSSTEPKSEIYVTESTFSESLLFHYGVLRSFCLGSVWTNSRDKVEKKA